MNTELQSHHQGERCGASAFRVRLPGFLPNDEIGFGDVIKRATTTVGLKPCGGCARRAAALNHWLTFSGRRHS